jgi:reactive intermediate/imine deaminase
LAKRVVITDAAPQPSGAYTQAIVAGPFVFLAGQGPFTPDGVPVSGSFEDEARQAFSNLAAVAAAAGGSLGDAVRIGVFLRDMANFDAMDALYRTYVPEPLPARTTVQSDLPGFEIEVDAILYHGV